MLNCYNRQIVDFIFDRQYLSKNDGRVIKIKKYTIIFLIFNGKNCKVRPYKNPNCIKKIKLTVLKAYLKILVIIYLNSSWLIQAGGKPKNRLLKK